MSDLDTIERAIWEAERDTQRPVATIQMLRLTEMRFQTSAEWLQVNIQPLERTVFGIPILLDPTMPPNEIKLVSECGCVAKLIDFG